MMKKISRENAIKLIDEIRSIVEKEIDLSKCLEDSFSGDIIEPTEVDVYCQGISNGFLSEIVHAIIGYEVEVIGEVEELFPCPCCGFKTLTELYDLNEGTGYDICPYCKWEDDGTTEVNLYRPINRGSIEEYRNKIQSSLNKYYINKWFTDR